MAAVARTATPQERQHPALAFLTVAWSWLFLLLLLLFFETWARLAYGVSFLLNGYNLQSIAVSAAMPLLLGLGQTFVIIAGGIDLSVGFVMGFAVDSSQPDARNAGYGLVGGAIGLGALSLIMTATASSTTKAAARGLAAWADSCK